MKNFRYVLFFSVCLVTICGTQCAETDNELMMLKKVIQNLANNMKTLKIENEKVNGEMKAIQDEISNFKDETSELREEIARLKEENIDLKKEILHLKVKHEEDSEEILQPKDEKREDTKLTRGLSLTTSNVAFYARLSRVMSVYDNEVIIFDQVMTNLGGGYNGGSGVFRVTVRGYYVFFVNLLTEPHKQIEAYLLKNGGNFMSIYAGSRSEAYGPGSNMAVMLLEQADQVWVKVHDTLHDTGNVLDNVWCTFSGFLLYTA